MQNHLAIGSIFPFWEPQNTNYRGDSYRYGFNGKENDNEVQDTGNQQDYGFRIYDPRLGKFLSADPLIVQGRQYPELSPYQFASNRPIDGIDLDGLEVNLINNQELKQRPALYAASNIKVTNVIHVFAHANPEGIFDARGPEAIHITTATGFDEVMSEQSDVWKYRKEIIKSGIPVIVVFHSCRAAEFAKKMSDAYPEVIFIAAERKVNVNHDKGTTPYNSEEAQSQQDTSEPGTWNVYQDNKKIHSFEGRIKPEYNEDTPETTD